MTICLRENAKMRRGIVLAALAGSLLLLHVPAVAAQDWMEHHGAHMDDAMARQHLLMAGYAESQYKINAALKNRDNATIVVETRKLLATISDLKKTRPHRNLKERGKVAIIATGFEKDLVTVVSKAKKKDFVGAEKAFRMAEKRCEACHARFRD